MPQYTARFSLSGGILWQWGLAGLQERGGRLGWAGAQEAAMLQAAQRRKLFGWLTAGAVGLLAVGAGLVAVKSWRRTAAQRTARAQLREWHRELASELAPNGRVPWEQVAEQSPEELLRACAAERAPRPEAEAPVNEVAP